MTGEPAPTRPPGTPAGEPPAEEAPAEEAPAEEAPAEEAPAEEAPADAPDTFETLASDLRGPMLGAPRQQVTGLIIMVILVLGLLFGITSLARDGAFDVDVDAPLFPRPSASAMLVEPSTG